jgi:hypothetical protein
LAAALLVLGILAGLRAAFIPIRDNMDKFIEDLHRQGRWAATAAILAGAGSLLKLRSGS